MSADNTLTRKPIKVISWCHCSNCWMHYGRFKSIVDYNKHIKEKGFDPKYFRIEKDG